MHPRSLKKLSLRQLILMGLMTEEATEMVVELAEKAKRQFRLESTLNKMESEWKFVNFKMSRDKESNVLHFVEADEILQLLDEHGLKTQAMYSSPYVKPFILNVLEWEKRLSQVADVLEEWIKCQKSYLDLVPIFEADDITTNLNKE